MQHICDICCEIMHVSCLYPFASTSRGRFEIDSLNTLLLILFFDRKVLELDDCPLVNRCSVNPPPFLSLCSKRTTASFFQATTLCSAL